jgi:branched-chain amino acid transport system ATP-binding protein
VTYDDTTLTGLRPCDIAARGVVRTFQKTSVFPALTVAENVMIGLHLRGAAGLVAILSGTRRVREEERALRARAAEIIALVGLDHRRDDVASALPYGEQRLVEVAVALAARPRLLLLDEPAAGMTGLEKDRLIDLVRRVREQGVTVLLVEHDMRLVMGISDVVIVLNHGRVIAEGPPAAIQAHPDVIRAYLGSTRARD